MIKCNMIDGRWAVPSSTQTNVNPSDLNDVIGEYARGDARDVDAAVDAARTAYPAWAAASPQVRCDLLETVGRLLLARKDAIGRLLAREEGKTLAEAVAETVRAAQIFKYFAQETLRFAGEILPSLRPDVDVEVTREALGVVALITPWNFPIAIPAWKVAPALAYGNCVVLKPAELTPASAHVLAELMMEAGCPNGVFNLVQGAGSIVGEAFAQHAGIDALSFTGSVPVGQRIAMSAAHSLKKIQLELGGKNPMVVLDDADLDIAVQACIDGGFFSTGQRCTASSRIIAEARIHDAFAERMITAMNALKVGHALESSTQIGPVASRAQLESNLAYVALAAQEGAEVHGGATFHARTPGFYQKPALFIGARNDMRIAQEEIFGPCVALLRAGDFDEALAIANDTQFGLSAGICTKSLAKARTFKRKAQAGMVMVNLPTAGVDYHVPFGGKKGSSHGPREQGRFAIEFYTSVKTNYVRAE